MIGVNKPIYGPMRLIYHVIQVYLSSGYAWLLLLSLLGVQVWGQCPNDERDTLAFHDFETGLPDDWQAPQTSDGGAWQVDEGKVGYYPNPGQGAWAYVNDEASNNVGKAVLETSEYDLGAYDGEITLSYDFLFQEYADSGLVSLEIFEGRSWVLVLQDTSDFSGRIELDLSSFAGNSVKFRWTFSDEGAWAWGMGLDNFLLRAQRTSCGNGRCEGGESPESCPEDCPMRVQPAPAWVELGEDIEGKEVNYRYFKGGTRCDDCSEEIELPFEFDLYGSLHDRIYLNANGNFTFEESYKEYTPQPFCLDGPLMLAPFFADLDLNAGGAIYYYLDPDGHYLIVQWLEVGYFGCGADCGLKNSFQAVLTDGSVRKVAELEVPVGINAVFSYGDMQWTTGSSSGGVNGLGGSAATVGLNSGNGVICASLGAFNRPGFDYYGSTVGNQCPTSAVSYLDYRSFLVDAGEAYLAESQTVTALSLELSAEAQGSYNVLRCAFSQYISGGRLILERSSNGEEWAYVQTLPDPTSPSDLEVQWRDSLPFPRFTYYRVYWSQEGKVPTYSMAVSVEREGAQQRVAQGVMEWISIGPNPMQEVLALALEVPIEEEVLLTLVDLNGRPLLQKSLGAQEARQGSQLLVSQLPPGTYVLHARQGHQQISQKLIKS